MIFSLKIDMLIETKCYAYSFLTELGFRLATFSVRRELQVVMPKLHYVIILVLFFRGSTQTAEPKLLLFIKKMAALLTRRLRLYQSLRALLLFENILV